MRLSPGWLRGIRCRFQPTFGSNTLTGKCCTRQRALITDSLTLSPRLVSLPNAVCVCPIGQFFQTNRNTRLDTSLASTCLASPELSSPRVDFMCGLWQSCSLINDGCNAISIGFQWPQCNRARVRQREREGEWEGTCIVLRLFSICQCTNQNCHTFFTVYFPFSTQFINFNSKTYSSWSAMINMICLSSLINGSCGLGDRKH